MNRNSGNVPLFTSFPSFAPERSHWGEPDTSSGSNLCWTFWPAQSCFVVQSLEENTSEPRSLPVEVSPSGVSSVLTGGRGYTIVSGGSTTLPVNWEVAPHNPPPPPRKTPLRDTDADPSELHFTQRCRPPPCSSMLLYVHLCSSAFLSAPLSLVLFQALKHSLI